jgi:hypothetical protein
MSRAKVGNIAMAPGQRLSGGMGAAGTGGPQGWQEQTVCGAIDAKEETRHLVKSPIFRALDKRRRAIRRDRNYDSGSGSG